MSLRRVFGYTSLHTPKYNLQQWMTRIFHNSPQPPLFGEKRTNSEEPRQLSKKYESVPECQPPPCESEIPRADDKFPFVTKIAKDEIGAYVICPPTQEKKKFSCSDLPMEVRPMKRKRKPFVPASACKKPKPSPSAECERLKKDVCLKLSFPNCMKARNPPKCLKEFKRPDCRRVPNPVPAYSECFKPPKKTRKDECECLSSKRLCLNGGQ